MNRGKITKTFDPREKRKEKKMTRVKKGMFENKMEKEYMNVSDVV